MTKEELRIYHNNNCLKNDKRFINLKDYEWLGCPYPSKDRKIKIDVFTMDTASLYKCKKCGLEILSAQKFRKAGEMPLNVSFAWEGSDTYKKFYKVWKEATS